MNAVNKPDTLEPFEAHRPLMFSIAYRMLGSTMEAEDIVQEAYLRYQAVSPAAIHSPKAFLSTVVTRLCLNQLESARVKREEYIGPWLPEPVLTEAGDVMALNTPPPSPSQQAELHESISLAFLVLLEQLTPVERAVFLLREVFDYEYAEIAEILEKDEAACRQLFSRAKKHIAAHRPRFKAAPERHRQLLSQFMRAVSTGQLDGLMQLLSDDVTMWVDGGGKARGAAIQPLHGRMAVAQFVLASIRFLAIDYQVEVTEVNGQPAAILRVNHEAVVIIALEIDRDSIHEIRVMGNPDKLKRV
jgi:RNA polymerase sigma-70 factor (ECF subfamily)